jgi:N6-adenosine-specific RNA methylase IME4
MTDDTKIKIDPTLAGLLPPLRAHALEGLEADLLRDGCIDSLIVWNGVLVDGHHRYSICQKHGIPFSIKQMKFDSLGDACLGAWNHQDRRRNTNSFDRIERLLQCKTLVSAIKAKAKERMLAGKKSDPAQNSAEGETRQELAAATNVSHDTIAKVEFLRAHADDRTKEQLRAGEISINAAVKDIRRQQKRAGVTTGTAPVPTSKYRVIYADPPWQYGNAGLTEYGHAESHYPTMPLSDICAMPVLEWAEDDAVLFLWATSPMLENAFQVIRAWGFKYKTSFVWDKVKHNFGHYNSVRHEFLLVCTRGSCTPDASKLFDSVQTIERSARHSEKPEEFRKIIETLYARGARLELFARARHSGWSTFGNQLDTAAV